MTSTPVPEPFERVGNALCLDFTNTVNVRPRPQRDLLDDVSGLTGWMRLAGVSTPRPVAPHHLEQARVLREHVYGVFAPLTTGAPLPQSALRDLHAEYADHVRRASWVRATNTLEPAWPVARAAYPTLAREVLRSTFDLLRAGPLDRLHSCPGCGWLFLDVSRNGQRRWCSMLTCGSRSKSAAYYGRTSAGQVGPHPHRG